MKIGYYEENNYHTEILATFIEPFLEDIKLNKIEFIVYNSQDKSEWIDFYKKYYYFTLKNNEAIINDIEYLDKIIIGTSINISKFLDILDEKKKDSIKNKIYYICHLKEDLIKSDNSKTIVLTPLNQKFVNNYIFPINNCYNLVFNKKKLIIGLIGRFKDDNRDIADLINLITNYSKFNICIYIFSRHAKFIPKTLLELQQQYPNNLKIFLKKNTEYMISIFKDIKFICPLSNKESIYYKDRLTGLLPISYNFNIPCLLEKDLANIYQIKNCIKYEKSITEIIPTIINMEDTKYLNLVQNLITDKQNIINTNNSILKQLLIT